MTCGTPGGREGLLRVGAKGREMSFTDASAVVYASGETGGSIEAATGGSIGGSGAGAGVIARGELGSRSALGNGGGAAAIGDSTGGGAGSITGGAGSTGGGGGSGVATGSTGGGSESTGGGIDGGSTAYEGVAGHAGSPCATIGSRFAAGSRVSGRLVSSRGGALASAMPPWLGVSVAPVRAGASATTGGGRSPRSAARFGDENSSGGGI
ncbi:MAG: hypothetical protein KA129_11415, partial [Microthrixaceae bacterium]|nr:hypothetical protein [Microthrixaceae bacterium]